MPRLEPWREEAMSASEDDRLSTERTVTLAPSADGEIGTGSADQVAPADAPVLPSRYRDLGRLAGAASVRSGASSTPRSIARSR